MKKFLVATDGSEYSKKAVKRGAEAALRWEAILYIMHVVRDAPITEASRNNADSEPMDVNAEKEPVKKTPKDIMGEAQCEAAEAGLDNTKLVLDQGDPAHKIIKFAKENNIDMIFMGHRGLDDSPAQGFGSVCRSVLHDAKCQCVIVC